MRILIWSPVCRSPESADWLWLQNGMTAAGHELVAVDAYALGDIFGPERMQEILLAYARTYGVQVALVLPHHGIGPEFLQRLRAQNVVVVRLHPDDELGMASALPLCHPAMMALDAGIGAACDLTVTCSPNAGVTEGPGGPLAYLPLPLRPDPAAPDRPSGWENWWLAVAETLARRGIGLDVAAPLATLVPGTTTLMALAATVLGHVREHTGQAASARMAYAEAFRYDPRDYSANTGLARLAADPETARHHWRTATDHIGTRLVVGLPSLLSLPGIPIGGTQFVLASAVEWARLTRKSHLFSEMVEATSYLSPFAEDAGRLAARSLLENGLEDLARLCLEMEIANWPQNLKARQLQDDLLAGRPQAGADATRPTGD